MKVILLILITGFAGIVFGLLYLIFSARRYARAHTARQEAEQKAAETAE